MKQFTFSTFLMAMLVVPLFSQENPVEIHGAISQSVIYSKNNHYIYEGSKGGSLDYSEAFINFSHQFGSNLRVGMQLSARNFGDQENFEPKLDWAYGDYRVVPWFGMRIGRVKLPLGIYNETRDVDFAKSNILLDQGIYPETLRLLLNAYTGGSFYGTIDFNSIAIGELDYELYAGVTDIPDAYPSNEYTRKIFGSPKTSITDVKMVGSHEIYHALDFLKIGHSFMYSTSYLSIESENISVIDDTNSGLFDFSTPYLKRAIYSEVTINIFSTELQYNDFTLVSEIEIMQLETGNTDAFNAIATTGIKQQLEDSTVTAPIFQEVEATMDAPLSDAEKEIIKTLITKEASAGFGQPIVTKKTAWYVHLFHQTTDDLGFFGGFGYVTQNNSLNIARLQIEPNSRNADQKDYSLGFNYYFNDNFLIKGEYHYIDGNYGVYNPIGETLIDDGNLWVGRVSYSF